MFKSANVLVHSHNSTSRLEVNTTLSDGTHDILEQVFVRIEAAISSSKFEVNKHSTHEATSAREAMHHIQAGISQSLYIYIVKSISTFSDFSSPSRGASDSHKISNARTHTHIDQMVHIDSKSYTHTYRQHLCVWAARPTFTSLNNGEAHEDDVDDDTALCTSSFFSLSRAHGIYIRARRIEREREGGSSEEGVSVPCFCASMHWMNV